MKCIVCIKIRTFSQIFLDRSDVFVISDKIHVMLVSEYRAETSVPKRLTTKHFLAKINAVISRTLMQCYRPSLKMTTISVTNDVTALFGENRLYYLIIHIWVPN